MTTKKAQLSNDETIKMTNQDIGVAVLDREIISLPSDTQGRARQQAGYHSAQPSDYPKPEKALCAEDQKVCDMLGMNVHEFIESKCNL